MSAALQLYLIRHGETAWLITGQHAGFTDIPLTAHGDDEARALAPHLRTIHFTKILTSPSRRARQTYELTGHGAEAEMEPDLVELNEGRSQEAARALLDERRSWISQSHKNQAVGNLYRAIRHVRVNARAFRYRFPFPA